MAVRAVQNIRWRSTESRHPLSRLAHHHGFRNHRWKRFSRSTASDRPARRRRAHHLLRQRGAARSATRRRPVARAVHRLQPRNVDVDHRRVSCSASRSATPSAAALADRYPTPANARDRSWRSAPSRRSGWSSSRSCSRRPGAHKSIGLGLANSDSRARAVPAGRVRAEPAHAAGDQARPAGRVEDRPRRGHDLRALSTLGCLLGNYLTGFVLIQALHDQHARVLLGRRARGPRGRDVRVAARHGGASRATRPLPGNCRAIARTTRFQLPRTPTPSPTSGSRTPIVFLASFGGMTLELTASRVLAQYLGVSLFTWTGIIGVMLAGTALGTSRRLLADRASQPGGMRRPLDLWRRSSRPSTVFHGLASTLRTAGISRSRCSWSSRGARDDDAIVVRMVAEQS